MSKKYQRKIIRNSIKDILKEQIMPPPGQGGQWTLGACNTYNYNDGDAYMSQMFQNGCYGALTGTWMMVPSPDGWGNYIPGIVEGYNDFCDGQPIGQGTPHDGGIAAQFMSMGEQWEDISCAMCQCLSQGWPEWPPDESNNDNLNSCSNPEASQVWNTFSDDEQQVFCSECDMMPNENDEALADYLGIPNVCEVCCNSLPDPEDPEPTGCEADPSIYPTPPIGDCKGPCNEEQYSQLIDTNTQMGQFFEMWCSGMHQPEDLDQAWSNGCQTVENVMSYGVNMCEICSCFGPDADFDDPGPEPDKDPVKDPVKDPFNYDPLDQTKPVDPTSGKFPGKAQKLRERFQKLANIKKGKGLIKD